MWSGAEGTTQKATLESLPDFVIEDMAFNTPLTADVLIIKLKNEVSVLVSNLKIVVDAQCQRCLSSYKQSIHIENVERQFFAEQPDRPQDFDALFYIDLQHMSIDLSEMFRQEIILHFPMIPLCLESCKGLCQHCGEKLQSQTCSCGHKVEEETSHQDRQQPFKNLKHLLYG